MKKQRAIFCLFSAITGFGSLFKNDCCIKKGLINEMKANYGLFLSRSGLLNVVVFTMKVKRKQNKYALKNVYFVHNIYRKSILYDDNSACSYQHVMMCLNTLRHGHCCNPKAT